MKKFLTVIGIISLVLLLLLASLGVWAYYKFLYTEPLSQSEMADISVDWDIVTRGNWSPWYDAGDGAGTLWNPAASYNAWVAGIPEDDKAWPLMVQAYFDHQDYFDNEVYSEYIGTLPTNPERWGMLEAYLGSTEADAILGQVMEALSKSRVGIVWSNETDPYEHAAYLKEYQTDPTDQYAFDPGPLQFDPELNYPMIDMMLPWLGKHRQLTNFVRCKAAYELERGNAEVFVSSMETLLASTELSKDLPTLISQLVENAIESVAIRTIDWGISTHRERFNEDQLARIDRAIASYVNPDYVWEGEALMFHDTIRRLCDDNGDLSISGVRSFQNSWGGPMGSPTSLPNNLLGDSPQRTLYVYNKMLRHASEQDNLDWDGTHEHTDDLFEQERDKLNFISEMFLDIMLPALDRPAVVVRQLKQETIGVRLGIAAYRHQLRHGAFPESIQAIDDDLIDFEPIDVFNADQLRYTLTENGPLVYSVGADRVDNGGRQGWITKTGWDGVDYRVKNKAEWLTAESAAGLKNDPEAQSDWVLFPMPPDEDEPIEPVNQDESDDELNEPAAPDEPQPTEQAAPEESDG
ncbi:MAG: hypothetical protein KDA29_01900 [Phycisphaerales bacterium]|nr:hypothetical protein [Phycisphaerales bacterium]